jgi:translation initiation factor 1
VADVPQPQLKTVLFLGTSGDERAPVAEAVFNAVAERMGLPWRGRTVDLRQAAQADLEGAAVVVAPDESGQRPVLIERLPAWAAHVQFWQVPQGPAARAAAEREVMALVARLLGGKAEPDAAETQAPAPPKKPAARPVVRVGRETKGRRGKGVTTVFDLPLSAGEIEQLAARLKQKCGTGGTVKGGVIEIQGDHRDRLVRELEGLGYHVKRAGG